MKLCGLCTNLLKSSWNSSSRNFPEELGLTFGIAVHGRNGRSQIYNRPTCRFANERIPRLLLLPLRHGTLFTDTHRSLPAFRLALFAFRELVHTEQLALPLQKKQASPPGSVKRDLN